MGSPLPFAFLVPTPRQTRYRNIYTQALGTPWSARRIIDAGRAIFVSGGERGWGGQYSPPVWSGLGLDGGGLAENIGDLFCFSAILGCLEGAKGAGGGEMRRTCCFSPPFRSVLGLEVGVLAENIEKLS